MILIFTQYMTSQSPHCFIKTDDPFTLSSQPRISSFSQSIDYYDRIPWSGFGQLKLVDEECTELLLAPGEKSEALQIKDFDFDLPANAIITGVTARLYGSSQGQGIVQDLNIRLLDDASRSFGMNKANRAIKGYTFNQRASIYPYWEYGSEWDDWNAELTPSLINDPDFGISIEMFNNSNEPVQLLLDQVLLTVFYEAPIQLCSDDHYISLYAEPDNDVKSYHWEIPAGLNYDPVDNFPYLISILTENSDFGSYTICLDKELFSGETEKCCTAFDYINCNKGSIGNFIWHDLDADGLQDGNEPGLHDKRVYLYNESMQFLKETITQDGFYSFNDLDPGSYFVKVEVPGMQPTFSDKGSDNNDSDFFEYLDDMMSGLIHLSAGQDINNLDFGLASRASVAGKLWNDRNANGIFESEDAPLDNVLVRLYDSGGLVDAFITDQDGMYAFTDLNPGAYQIKFIPGGLYSSSINGDDNDLEQGLFDVDFELDDIGQRIINGGFFTPSSIEGKLWLDNDFDSDFTQGDFNVNNTEVILLDCNGNTISTVVSNSEGLFEFNELMPGHYSLCVNNQNPGIYIAKEIECKDCFELLDDTKLKEQDFIFNPDSYSLELLLYSDRNTDDLYSILSDDLLESVSVSLIKCSDNSVVDTKLSGPDGLVAFNGLLEGEYTLHIEEYVNYVGNQNLPSNSNNGIIELDCFTVSDDQSLQFGFIKLAEIGDFVWHDENNNGIQDGTEMGLESIEFILLDENKEELAITSSDKNGYYSFEGLVPGNYYVMVFELESLFDLSLLNSGSSEADSDFYVDGGKVITEAISVAYFDSRNDIDLGLKLSAAMMRYDISGNLWRDSNGDLIRQVEYGLDGLNVELIKCAGGAVAETQTDINGDFVFENLKQDNYFMRMELPEGYSILYDNYRTVKSNQTECLFLTDRNIEVKSAFMPLSSIEGWLWLDTEVNGQQDNDEQGLEDIRVVLLDDEDNLVAEISTDASGIYRFKDVLPGIYRFEVHGINGSHTPTLQAIGNDASDSELRLENGRYISEYFEVFDGATVTEVDMGINLKSAIIGGTVFIDDSRDGIRNGVEKGLGSINISLFEAGGTLLQNTLADADGIYRFYQGISWRLFHQF